MGSVCFEWIGRQAKIKVKNNETRLVVTQARHKHSGDYMSWTELHGWASTYEVHCVGMESGLIGMTVAEAAKAVVSMQGSEGYVIHIDTGGGAEVEDSMVANQKSS